MNRRITAVILLILLSAFAVCGCTGKDETQTIEGIFIDCGEWGFLVRDTSDGEPYLFSYAMGTDVSGFKAGDKIVVEYTIEENKTAKDSMFNISDKVSLSVEYAEANEG